MKKAIVALASLVILAACHANYGKTPSGLPYKIFPGKGGMSLDSAKFVKMNIKYILSRNGKDSLLNSSFGKFPQYSPIDTSSRNAYTFMEILPKCHVGDSVEFTLSSDTLRKRNINLPLDIFPKGSSIKGRLKILNAFKTQESIMADVNKETKKVKDKELVDLDNYVTKNHLQNVVKSKNGVRISIENPGTGMKADSGTVANVRYKGYLLNGSVFDTNMDDSKGHLSAEGYPVHVGTHGVIQGWDEALPYFAKGGKGKLVIPSDLGYGQQGSPDIPAGSTLVFDIEIVDVKPAAAAPAPTAPAQSQPQKR